MQKLCAALLLCSVLIQPTDSFAAGNVSWGMKLKSGQPVLTVKVRF